MGQLTDLLAPMLGLVLAIFVGFFFMDKKKIKEADAKLDELNNRRAAEKEYIRRQAAKVEAKRRELEEKLKDIEELDMSTESARDYIRDRYGSTDKPV